MDNPEKHATLRTMTNKTENKTMSNTDTNQMNSGACVGQAAVPIL